MENVLLVVGLLLLVVAFEVNPASVNERSDKKVEKHAHREQEVIVDKDNGNKTTIEVDGNEEQECKPYAYCKYMFYKY